MLSRSFFLISTVFVAFSSALLSPNLQPKLVEVTAENEKELGLPVGTVLHLDEHTNLYQPPPLAENFTAWDRLVLMYNNAATAPNYCKVGPDIQGSTWTYTYWWYQWCKDADGRDLCCNGAKCSCNSVKNDCACLSEENYDFYENKKKTDLKKVKGISEGVLAYNPIYQAGKKIYGAVGK